MKMSLLSSLLPRHVSDRIYPSMRQYGISILPSLCSLLCILPLQAQDTLDDNGAADDNGLLGAGFGDMPEMPESIRVTNDGTLEFDSKLGTFLFKGSVVVQGDNGLVLKAGRVLVNSKSETASLAGHVSVRQKSTKGKDGKIIGSNLRGPQLEAKLKESLAE